MFGVKKIQTTTCLLHHGDVRNILRILTLCVNILVWDLKLNNHHVRLLPGSAEHAGEIARLKNERKKHFNQSKNERLQHSVIRRTEQLDQPDTGKFYACSTPAPGRGSGYHCSPHSEIVSGRCT